MGPPRHFPRWTTSARAARIAVASAATAVVLLILYLVFQVVVLSASQRATDKELQDSRNLLNLIMTTNAQQDAEIDEANRRLAAAGPTPTPLTWEFTVPATKFVCTLTDPSAKALCTSVVVP